MAEADADTEADDGGDEADVDELVARAAAHDEDLAAAVADLEAEHEERGETIEALESRLKRERADFQNYKKRAKERQEEIRERATEDLIERLLDVRDNLVRALEQDDDAGIRDGVEATLATFDRVLEGENVSAIEPAPGDAVDPERHEVVMRVEEGEQPADAIEEVYRPGYELAGTVLRPAQVTVSGDPDG